MWQNKKMISNTSKISKLNNLSEYVPIGDEDILSKVPSLIMSDISIEGTITSQGVIEIGGKIQGNIKANCVTIRKEALILGNINANYLLVHGKIEGNLEVNNLIMSSSGNVKGKIIYNKLVFDYGAIINGELVNSLERMYDIKNIDLEKNTVKTDISIKSSIEKEPFSKEKDS